MAVLLQAKAVAFSIGGVERGDQDGLGVGTGWNGAKRMSGGQATPSRCGHAFSAVGELFR